MVAEQDNHFPGRIYVQIKKPKKESVTVKVIANKRNNKRKYCYTDKSDYGVRMNELAVKLAEIDYMLGVIEKNEMKKTSNLYKKDKVLSEIKVLLSKRLVDFANAEGHRDVLNIIP